MYKGYEHDITDQHTGLSLSERVETLRTLEERKFATEEAGGETRPRPLSPEIEYVSVDARAALAALWRSLAWILAATLAGALVGAVVSIFFMRQLYEATTIIRPTSQNSAENGLGSLGGGLGIAGGGLGGLLGGSNNSEAQEQLTIIRSYGFTSAVIDKHQLRHLLLHNESALNNLSPVQRERHLRWEAYKRFQARLSCSYSAKTDNITISFLDTNAPRAEQILGYLIDDLRERLRNQQLERSDEAASSLRDAIGKTSDVTLQNRLYELLAREIERVSLAKFHSDFAFAVLEAPVASDKPARPRKVLITVAGGVGGMLIATLLFLWIDFRRRSRRKIKTTIT